MVWNGFDGMWSPLRQSRWLERELGRVFRGLENRGSEPGFPRLNLWSDEAQVVLSLELPGVDPDGVEVQVERDTLFIRGERVEEQLADGARFVRRERAHGKFARTVELPFEADPETVQARFRHGVLEVRLPRPEKELPRKIAIEVEKN